MIPPAAWLAAASMLGLPPTSADLLQRAACGDPAAASSCGCGGSAGPAIAQVAQLAQVIGGPNGCFQPGFINCEPNAGTVAPCQVQRITQRLKVGSQVLTAIQLTAAAAAGLGLAPAPLGFSYYGFILDPVLVAGCVRVRNFSMTDGGGPVVPSLIALTHVCLYNSPTSSYVFGVEFPVQEDVGDIQSTTGRCDCAALVDWQAAQLEAAVIVLAPTTLIGYQATLQVRRFSAVDYTACCAEQRGPQQCFGCECPPADLCDRAEIAQGTDVPDLAAWFITP
jgi:hypothetical protein